MKKVVDVNTGEVKIGRGKTVLRSVAIGSCIVVAAYDSKSRIGAMAHVMLPGSAPRRSVEKTKYAADAIEQMLNSMIEEGVSKDNVEACLVGGGNVLKKKGDTICRENISSTTQVLGQEQIPIRGSVLGGTERKGIFMDVESGKVTCTEGDGPERLLWKAAERAP
ncbi:MAG: chemotaxis protein CheD [Planctomycetota bacterium]|jgi:chemotaxis protein CheD